jgi:electron transport complex protein RnfD
MLKGGFGEIPSLTQMLLGEMGGSLGEVSAIALLIGLVYLLATKTITWHIPVSILATVLAITGVFYLVDPTTYANPLVHLLSGGLLLGAIFMATDYVTSPMTHKGQLIYGFGIGLITCVIRLWGAYPEGMSFAILIMNAATPLINNYVKPTRFGAKEKGGKK